MSSPLVEPVSGPAAWTADTPLANDGVVALNADVEAEMVGLAEELGANRLPIEALHADQFTLPASTALMADVKKTLVAGTGFAILDRLPVEAFAPEVLTKLYWVLMTMIGPPVAQKWDGQMVYDVTDTGRKERAGNGVRSSKTNQGQYYHTDNSFNLPPDFVSLLCVRPARQGGASGLVSFQAAYNILAAEAPDLAARLHEPFYFDRQHEHAPGDDRLSFKPVFLRDGDAVAVTFSRRLIEYGYQLSDVDMDEKARRAVTALCDIIERPDMGRTFDFEPGQIQIVNNRRLGHRRTAFEDWPDTERKRHLVRIWIRLTGRPFYHG